MQPCRNDYELKNIEFRANWQERIEIFDTEKPRIALLPIFMF